MEKKSVERQADKTRVETTSLIKFVDEKYRPPRMYEVFVSYPPSLVGLILICAVLAATLFAWTHQSVVQWTPDLTSIIALLVAYYSIILASSGHLTKRLTNKEAKRLCALYPEKGNEIAYLLLPLVALKQENYRYIKLEALYEANKEMFTKEKLTEYYDSYAKG